MTPRPNPQLNRLRDSLQKSRTQFQVIPFQVIPFPCAECAVATTGRAVALRTCVVEALAEPTATPVSAAATVPTTAACRSPFRNLPGPPLVMRHLKRTLSSV
jgi:hypothetical protein